MSPFLILLYYFYLSLFTLSHSSCSHSHTLFIFTHSHPSSSHSPPISLSYFYSTFHISHRPFIIGDYCEEEDTVTMAMVSSMTSSTISNGTAELKDVGDNLDYLANEIFCNSFTVIDILTRHRNLYTTSSLTVAIPTFYRVIRWSTMLPLPREWTFARRCCMLNSQWTPMPAN